MKRKQFIRQSGTVLAGGLLASHFSCTSDNTNAVAPDSTPRTNWAGNYTYKAEHLYEPTSAEQLRTQVKNAGKQKALGSRHCFNDIADSPGSQISTAGLNKVVHLDKENKTLTVEAGARYGEFCKQLDEQGFALHNLASLPHITVAGACATATHGSGVHNGNLATAVLAAELVTPDGTIVQVDRDHPDFPAIIVGLGAFGIITNLTLQLLDTFKVRQDVFQDLPLQSVEASFDAIMSGGYSVSLFTDWMDKKISEVWVKRKVDAGLTDLGNDYFGARAATENLHPIAGLSAENCTDQMGVPGPWYDRLPHFKMGFTPSAGKELQSEFFVGREHAVSAILAIESMREKIHPHLLITEIRTIAADQFWMSPCYERDSVAIHFTWKQEPEAVMTLLPAIEEALAPFDVRPHWGKLFTVDPEVLHQRYPRFQDFLALAKKYDPEGKFANVYLDKNVYGVGKS